MIELKQLLEAGVHFGHKTSRWHPKMRPFIWGAKNKVHLIDISKTAFLLERAGKTLKELASEGGVFLFVGTKKASQDIIQRTAMNLDMPYVVHRWVGGTLSNYDQVRKAITRLLHLRDVVKKSTAHYKKKEIVMLQKEIARLEKNVGGILNLEYPPAGVVIVDAKKEQAAVKEASRLGIPVIALVDTNTDPEGVSMVIPANDDSPKSISFVVNYLETCIKDGKKLFEEKKAKDKADLEAKRAAAKAEATAKAAEKVAEKIAAATAEKSAAAAGKTTPEAVTPKADAAPAPVKPVDAPAKKTASTDVEAKKSTTTKTAKEATPAPKAAAAKKPAVKSSK